MNTGMEVSQDQEKRAGEGISAPQGASEMSQFEREVRAGRRFEFGKNWRAFQSVLTDERIRIAEKSLQELIGLDVLCDRTFLDIGSGSGLFSLAARNLGATVCSLDFDPDSVACTRELRSRYFPEDTSWTIHEASVLDKEFLGSLGKFDIVYSWGVLHHTGRMWDALENVAQLVRYGGILCLAIYNDRGRKLKYWWRGVKKCYCSGFMGRMIMTTIFIPYFFFHDGT